MWHPDNVVHSIDASADLSVPPAAESQAAVRFTVPAETGHRLVADALLPGWLRPVINHIDGTPLPDWVLHATDEPPPGARRGAVLMLMAEGAHGPDLVITRRAATLRSHAGQPAFPGGALEPGEDDIAAALREAQEETALDPHSVVPAALLPQLYLPPSRFSVRPVLAHWRTPGPIRAVDPAETQRVARVPIASLADPANRGIVVLTPGAGSGLRQTLRTPAFRVDGFTVWGFTAGLVDLLLEWGGWAVPWDHSREMVPESTRIPSGSGSLPAGMPATGLSPAGLPPEAGTA